MSRYGLLSDVTKAVTSTAVNGYALFRYRLAGSGFGLNATEKRDRRIIVTLTTIPSRLQAVQISLDCMLRQTVKPDKIILNLGEELFEGVSLPPGFDELEERGVEIRYVPYLCPHTKYFYTMREHPDDIVITIDDDVIYRTTVIEELYESYRRHPSAVSCLRAHRMLFDENGTLLPYNGWEYETTWEDTPSMLIFSTGAGGVLYPPGSLHKDLFNSDVFTDLCYRADDVWLKAMELLNGTPVVLASKNYRRLTIVKGSQKIALKTANVGKAENDTCIQNVFNHYGLTSSSLLERETALRIAK
jgi:hypothetical protein